jgi:CheY-like chemotaxis protein
MMAGETLLVVEDSALNRKLVETVLQAHGYRLLYAVDGEEAIATATRERPDLILMDLQLPKVSGYDAIRALKSQPETAHIPIAALTAHAMDYERQEALALGCVDYITKPINTRTFPDQVRRCLEARHRPETDVL